MHYVTIYVVDFSTKQISIGEIDGRHTAYTVLGSMYLNCRHGKQRHKLVGTRPTKHSHVLQVSKAIQFLIILSGDDSTASLLVLGGCTKFLNRC